MRQLQPLLRCALSPQSFRHPRQLFRVHCSSPRDLCRHRCWSRRTLQRTRALQRSLVRPLLSRWPPSQQQLSQASSQLIRMRREKRGRSSGGRREGGRRGRPAQHSSKGRSGISTAGSHAHAQRQHSGAHDTQGDREHCTASSGHASTRRRAKPWISARLQNLASHSSIARVRGYALEQAHTIV